MKLRKDTCQFKDPNISRELHEYPFENLTLTFQLGATCRTIGKGRTPKKPVKFPIDFVPDPDAHAEKKYTIQPDALQLPTAQGGGYRESEAEIKMHGTEAGIGERICPRLNVYVVLPRRSQLHAQTVCPSTGQLVLRGRRV